MEDFHRIKRLPPYVFAIVNDLKAAARARGEDILTLAEFFERRYGRKFRVFAGAAATGIARLNRIRQSALTDPIAIAYAMKHPGHSLVVLEQLAGPCSYGDTPAWLEDMLELVADWLNPLLETARSLEANVCIYPCNGVRYDFGHNNKPGISKLMFWKKESLRDHVETR